MVKKIKDKIFKINGENFVDEIAFEAKSLKEELGISSKEAIQLVLATKTEQYADLFIDSASVDKTDLSKTVERAGIRKIRSYKEDEDEDIIDYDGLPKKKQL